MKPLLVFLLCAGAYGQTASKPVKHVEKQENSSDEGCLQSTARGWVPCSDAIPVLMIAPDGSRIIKLSDEEYARLQKLRQAVSDAETEIAKAHRAQLDKKCPGWKPGEVMVCNTAEVQPDHYEYRGQYLLINVPAPNGGAK